MVNQYKKGQNKRIDAFRKKVVPVRMQNNNQNRNSVATVHSNPDNNDSELQAACAECTKSSVTVNSMLKAHNIKDIAEVKPIPLPRQNPPKQANAVELDNTETTLLKTQGEAAQKRRSKDSSHCNKRETGSMVINSIQSLKKQGLNI